MTTFQTGRRVSTKMNFLKKHSPYLVPATQHSKKTICKNWQHRKGPVSMLRSKVLGPTLNFCPTKTTSIRAEGSLPVRWRE